MLFADVRRCGEGVGIGCALGGCEGFPFPAVDDSLDFEVETVELGVAGRVDREGCRGAEGSRREECWWGGQEQEAECWESLRLDVKVEGRGARV